MLRRYRGVIAIGVVGVATAAWLAVTDPVTTSTAGPTTTIVAAARAADMDLPPEVIPWEVAVEQGRVEELDWGERCDTTTGRLKLPGRGLVGSCYARFTGDNGGATTPGVSATTIRVVAYRANTNDPLQALASGVGGAATDPVAQAEFQRGYLEMMSHYYELYGRRIELIEFTGTGNADDEVAAVADAETIANDLRPFAVIGGPATTNAFAETLAARRVICISCTPGQPNAFYEANDPFVWDLLKNPEQNGLMVNEYIGKRLAGRPARWAGDPAMRTRERVFGALYIDLGASTAEIRKRLAADRARYGFSYAVELGFGGPTELVGTARDLIASLKEAGVTTVVYSGDSLSPGTLTKVATDQGYFPEWVITGTALIDTNVVPRLLYDQRQWAHAFGPANLFIRSDHPFGPAELWEWYYGTPSPVPGAAATASAGPLLVLLLGLQATGAKVTPERFRNLLFQAPTIPSTSPTLGQISFGTRGVFDAPDYTAVDDQSEVWWDPDAPSVDELGNPGVGSWRWVEGGRRVLPGGWPRTEPDVFNPATAPVTLTEPPVDTTRYRPLR